MKASCSALVDHPKHLAWIGFSIGFQSSMRACFDFRIVGFSGRDWSAPEFILIIGTSFMATLPTMACRY